MEIVSLVVGICALIFSIGVYVIHDRKLKQQQKIIYEYQLRVIEKEFDEHNKAEVRASIINRQCDHSGNRSGTFIIKNYGKATAYNVRFSRDYKINFYAVDSRMFYHQLLSEEAQETYFECQWNTGGRIDAVVTWDDESGKGRIYKCTLDF